MGAGLYRIFPAYQLLIESHAKAQDVARNNEALDSGAEPASRRRGRAYFLRKG